MCALVLRLTVMTISSGKIIFVSLFLLFVGACSTQQPIKTETASDRLVAVANQRQAAGDYEG
ncbi:MAG: hypothetical protein ACWA5Q_04655, partial [bacterium]